MKKLSCMAAMVLMAILFSLSSIQAEDKDYSKPQELVDQSVNVMKRFAVDQNLAPFRELLKTAKAVFIVPRMLRGGLVFGGSGGSGALLARDLKTGAWSYPVFYTMGSVTFGLQLGADSSEIVLVVMTDKGMDSMLTTSFKLGADVSGAAGPVGVGAKAATADILAYSLSKGAYGGATVEGAVIKTKNDWNSAYYGQQVSTADVVIRHSVNNPGADVLRQKVAEMASMAK